MPRSSVERLHSLNQQAIAIMRLGIPLDLGLGSNPEEELADINDRLLIDAGDDLSPEDLVKKHAFPERYRAIALMLLATDDSAAVFESIALKDLNLELASNPIRQAMAEPALAFVLFYLGMILLCVFTVPHIEAQFEQEAQLPTGPSALLITLRNWMPYWIIGIPLAAAILFAISRRFSPGAIIKLFVGGRQFDNWLTAESQTRRLATLVAANVDEDHAIELACQSVSPNAPLRPLAEGIVRGGETSVKPQALNRLAKFYHFLADDRRRAVFSRTPALIGIFLAAAVVMTYGLATFLPWVQILNELGNFQGGGQ